MKTAVGISTLELKHQGKKRSWSQKYNQPATVAAGRGKVAERPFRGDALRARGEWGSPGEAPAGDGPGDPEGAVAHSHTNVAPFAKRSLLGSPAGPMRPGGSRGSACAPSTHPRNAGSGSAFPQRHAALTGISPRCGSGWNCLPPQRRASPAPRSRGAHGSGRSGHRVPAPALAPRVPPFAPGAEAPPQARPPGVAATRGGRPPGPAEPPRIPRPHSRAPGKRSGSHRGGRPPHLRPKLSRLQVKPGASTPLRGSSAASPGIARHPSPAP